MLDPTQIFILAKSFPAVYVQRQYSNYHFKELFHTQKRKFHDDVIKWKHFPRYWPFVRGIHRSPVNSPHKGQWRGALMFSLICARINGWVNNREAGDLRRNHAHHDVTVMSLNFPGAVSMQRCLLISNAIIIKTRRFYDHLIFIMWIILIAIYSSYWTVTWKW